MGRGLTVDGTRPNPGQPHHQPQAPLRSTLSPLNEQVEPSKSREKTHPCLADTYSTYGFRLLDSSPEPQRGPPLISTTEKRDFIDNGIANEIKTTSHLCHTKRVTNKTAKTTAFANTDDNVTALPQLIGAHTAHASLVDHWPRSARRQLLLLFVVSYLFAPDLRFTSANNLLRIAVRKNTPTTADTIQKGKLHLKRQPTKLTA